MGSGSAGGSDISAPPFTVVGGANCMGSRFLSAITMLLQFVIDMCQIERSFARRLVFLDREATPNGFPKCNILMETRRKYRKATLAQIGFSLFRQEGSCLDRIEHNPSIHDLLMSHCLNNLVVAGFSTAYIW